VKGLVLPAVVLLAWEAASHAGVIDPRILPPIESVLRAGWLIAGQRDVWVDLGASLARDLSGFAIGAVAGLIVGFVLGRFRICASLFQPSFDVVKQIALFAWIPLISMWFGTGEMAKVVFVALGAFVPMVLNTAEGVRSTPDWQTEVGRTLCLTRWQMTRRIYLPASVPSILTGTHLALIYSWLATIGAEYFMTTGPGLGGLIIEGRDRFAMDLVMLGVVLLGLIGFALNGIAELAEHRLLRWRPT